MTVSSTTNRKTFTGNGSTTSFALSPVTFFESSDLAVYVVTTATGAKTTLVENTDYTISSPIPFDGTGTVDMTGGSVPYGAPSAAQTLVVVRTLPLTQETDFVNNDASDAEVVEDALDRLVMIEQQLKAQLDRAFHLSDSDVSGVDLELPEVSARASKFVSFDATGALEMSVGSDGTGGALSVLLTSTAGAASIGILDNGALFAATNVETALAETATGLAAHLADTSAAHAASAISYAGGTGMSATDVEAAIDELANEKLDATSFSLSGLSLTATAAEINTLDRSATVAYHQDNGHQKDIFDTSAASGGTNGSVGVGLINEVNGVIRYTTGADAGGTLALNGIVQTSTSGQWQANSGGLFCEFRVRLSAITNVAVFVGFTDAWGTLEMPINSAASADTITTTATDAVGIMFDTSMATDDWWMVGVANNVDATKQDSAVAPSAATWETWRIDVSATGVATFKRNGSTIGSSMTGAVTANVVLTPVVAAFSRGAASRNIDIDYFTVGATRV